MELLLLYSFYFIRLCLFIYNVRCRKTIYIELQLETGHGKATKTKGVTASSFTEDTTKNNWYIKKNN